MMYRAPNILKGAVLVTETVSTKIIKSKVFGDFPMEIISVPRIRPIETYQTNVMTNNIHIKKVPLSLPTNLVTERKRIKERTETLFCQAQKASNPNGGSGKFWFIAFLLKANNDVNDDHLVIRYINAGLGLEMEKLTLFPKENVLIEPFICSKYNKAIAIHESMLSSPKGQTLKTESPKTPTAKLDTMSPKRDLSFVSPDHNLEPKVKNPKTKKNSTVLDDVGESLEIHNSKNKGKKKNKESKTKNKNKTKKKEKVSKKGLDSKTKNKKETEYKNDLFMKPKKKTEKKKVPVLKVKIKATRAAVFSIQDIPKEKKVKISKPKVRVYRNHKDKS